MSVYSNKITKRARDQSGNSGHHAYWAFDLSARHTHVRTHTCAHMRMRTRAHTHTPTHPHTHTHTHTHTADWNPRCPWGVSVHQNLSPDPGSAGSCSGSWPREKGGLAEGEHYSLWWEASLPVGPWSPSLKHQHRFFLSTLQLINPHNNPIK